MTTTASSDHTAPHQHDTRPSPPGHSAPALAAPTAAATPPTPGSRLGPAEDFPEDLAGLGMGDLQVLHSRITRQLDHDYLTDPAGPHVSTMDRCQDLRAELNARDGA